MIIQAMRIMPPIIEGAIIAARFREDDGGGVEVVIWDPVWELVEDELVDVGVGSKIYLGQQIL